jgi:hypothetical protein
MGCEEKYSMEVAQCRLFYIYELYNKVVSSSDPIWLDDHWINNWEEYCTQWSSPHLWYYPKIVWRDWEKAWMTSVRITGTQTEIWLRDLPSTKHEYYAIDRDVWSGSSILTGFYISGIEPSGSTEWSESQLTDNNYLVLRGVFRFKSLPVNL